MQFLPYLFTAFSHLLGRDMGPSTLTSAMRRGLGGKSTSALPTIPQLLGSEVNIPPPEQVHFSVWEPLCV